MYKTLAHRGTEVHVATCGLWLDQHDLYFGASMWPQQDINLCLQPFQIPWRGWVSFNMFFSSNGQPWRWIRPRPGVQQSHQARIYMFLYFHIFSDQTIHFCCDQSINETIQENTTPRLSAQLLQTTWSQSELQVESDLQKLRAWASKFELYSHQQVSWSMLLSQKSFVFWTLKPNPKQTAVGACSKPFVSPGIHGFQVPERQVHEGQRQCDQLLCRETQTAGSWFSDVGAFNNRGNAGSHGCQWVSQQVSNQ